ncbi:hypothetical protein Tco_0034730 [Tanacetum coccineum]
MVSGNNYNRVDYDYYAKTSHPSAHRNMVPRAVLLKSSLTPLNTARPVNTVMGHCYSVRPRAVNTAMPYTAPVNAVRAKRVNVVKTSACWVWRPTRPNGASLGKPQRDDMDFITAKSILVLLGQKVNTASTNINAAMLPLVLLEGNSVFLMTVEIFKALTSFIDLLIG